MMIAMLRGGGDLASGVVVRLARAGIHVVVTELAQPMAVRRRASFAQAIYDGDITIEGLHGVRVHNAADIHQAWLDGAVAVLVDPDAAIHAELKPHVLVDGRMHKRAPEPEMHLATMVVGLGPGFTAGADCHAVVETKRGPYLGRVYWQGSAEPDSGQPETVHGHQGDRVLRAPADGVLRTFVDIGAHVEEGDELVAVGAHTLTAPFAGTLRGLLMDGLHVAAGEKIGDLDPRDDPALVGMVSDKALAIGGGVMEAIFSWPEMRRLLCQP